jgi:hypothetical protein
VEIGGKLLTYKFSEFPGEARAKHKIHNHNCNYQGFLSTLPICSLKINLSLVVMMSAVNPWKPPQPPRRQPVVTKVFCAFNVCISDISGKLLAEQTCGIFHPQDPTEYPRHFQSFCTIANANNGAARLTSLSLYI